MEKTRDIFKHTLQSTLSSIWAWKNIISILTGGRVTEAGIVKDASGNYFIYKKARPWQAERMKKDVRLINFLWSKNIPGVPRILQEWNLPDGTPILLQTYTPWKLLSSIEDTSQIVFSWMIDGLINMHQITSKNKTWGYPEEDDLQSWSAKSMKEYILSFMGYIDKSDYLNDHQKSKLRKGILQYLDRTSDPNKSPSLIHGDIHDYNIVVDEKNTAHLIDFWEARYTLPEEEFGRAMINETSRHLVHLWIKMYTEKTWTQLDKNLMILFMLCAGAKHLRKDKHNERQKNLWDWISKYLE